MATRNAKSKEERKVLFVQAMDPAGYPPLIHASGLMAEFGWRVTFLSAPIAGSTLELPPHPRITTRVTRTRPSHVMRKIDYAHYLAAAAHCALFLRPDVVYASDPLGAAPGLIAASIARARLVYHEHDTPDIGGLRTWVARLRARATRYAQIVIFPNEARAHIVQAELDLSADQVRVVWNVPRRAELPELVRTPENPLILHYHGGISPDRLPEAVVEAVRRMNGPVRLRIVGSETPGAPGYLTHLIRYGDRRQPDSLIQYAGQVPRSQLLSEAAKSHIGLAFMPPRSNDINMTHMAGASNKAFDYMAAGLALLVSDIGEWREMFVERGFARACNPNDPDSITVALKWFLDNPAERRALGARGRNKIEKDWNYESLFSPVIAELSEGYDVCA
jgi:glycosyltransferase involved in cell wall biosynthesis